MIYVQMNWAARHADAAGPALLSFAVGSREEVGRFVELLRADGVTVIGNPRLTGGGYYEAVVADPEGNIVEITV